MFTVTKTYRDLPAAHRQPNHKGHCRLIHGHNWGFDIEIGAAQLDECGFVVDVGALWLLKDFLVGHFDHTLLLNSDDPFLQHLQNSIGGLIDPGPFAKIVVVKSCGMEGLAEFVYRKTQSILVEADHLQQRGVHVRSVVCWEDSKNRATYRP